MHVLWQCLFTFELSVHILRARCDDVKMDQRVRRAEDIGAERTF